LLLTVTDVFTTCAVVVFRVKVIWVEDYLKMTLKMTTAQVVETSVTVNNNSPIQDYVHPDDQTQPTFEIMLCCLLVWVVAMFMYSNNLYF